ncbi:tumor necrosis factor receptor superfamily member 13C isoform X1 [Piliocolobus tephrosceles]|uniref:TNF receptor superfamily member 13C n=1 Tax=Piliocolobus tephrosceles TaxID=591936 RepID=A0A8C9LSX7_9PRIM|nr:tumor necrosis factor receptor superfamily member 13C isoform X1 [Piliocolobus tephrosceles]
MKRGPRSLRGRDAPAPTPCVPAECFDLLVRHCVACGLLRTPRPKPAAPASSSAPRTALQPQESVGAGAGEAALSLPGLLFGAPALLGLALVLALVLLGLVSWRRRQRRLRGASFAEAPDGGKDKDEPLDKVIILSPGISDAAAPAWPPLGEDPGTTPPGHSVPVPATELGSTELVTTKTAGPEQQ